MQCSKCGVAERLSSDSYCRSCRNEYNNQWLKNNSKKWNAYLRRYNKERREKVFIELGGQCVQCGETDVRVLQINHLGVKKRGERSNKTVNAILNGSLSKLEVDLRCANCNILYEVKV